MRARYFFVLIVFLFLFSFSLISAQREIVEGVPFGNQIVNIVDDGKVKGVEDTQKAIEQFREGQNVSYLRQEWSKMPYIGKVFGFTEGFFSFFNPLWRYTFGMEFAWNLIFFFHVFIWGVIIFFVYFPAKEVFKGSSVAGLVIGVIFASITGSIKIISKVVDFYIKSAEALFGNFWLITLFVVMTVLIVFALILLYKKFFKQLEKESEEEKLKRAKQSMKTQGKIYEDDLKDV